MQWKSHVHSSITKKCYGHGKLGELSLTNAAYAKEILKIAATYKNIGRALREDATKKVIDQVMTQIGQRQKGLR